MRFSIFLALFVLVFCGCGDAPPTIDGYTYKTVKIRDREWFAENLKTTVYANGDEVPYSRTDESWETQEMGMRCSYDHDEARSAHYGQLYNWYAVNDERGLCPKGWHVPSDKDWQDLEVFLGMSAADVSRGNGLDRGCGISTKLKAKNGWEDDGNGTDDFGFSALPGGYRGFNGGFLGAGRWGKWWSSSSTGGSAWARELEHWDSCIERSNSGNVMGFSVRCLRDAD